MRKLYVLIFILFLISNISANCEKGQIDVNNANLDELDRLHGIGAAKAQSIIDFRESENFNSLEDLIKVKGIGEVTLENIKNQGLACVEELKETEEKIEKPLKEEKIQKEIIQDEFQEDFENEKIEEEIIVLNSKDIKTEESEKLNKNHLATYGLIGFCLLLGFLYLVKQKIRLRKNEFK